MKRSPAAAVWLSLVPGAGHIYAGDVAKGILLVLLVGSTIQIVSHGAEGFGILIPFVWLYAMIDAHRAAVEANRRIASGASPMRNPGVGIASWWGYVLIALGVLFAAENFDLIDFEWIWRLWPLGLVGLGIWVLRRKESPPPAEALPPLPADESRDPASAVGGENG
jgi:hypothetical protein